MLLSRGSGLLRARLAGLNGIGFQSPRVCLRLGDGVDDAQLSAPEAARRLGQEVAALAALEEPDVWVLRQELAKDVIRHTLRGTDVPTTSVATVGDTGSLKSGLRLVTQKEWISPPITATFVMFCSTIWNRRRRWAAG